MAVKYPLTEDDLSCMTRDMLSKRWEHTNHTICFCCGAPSYTSLISRVSGMRAIPTCQQCSLLAGRVVDLLHSYVLPTAVQKISVKRSNGLIETDWVVEYLEVGEKPMFVGNNGHYRKALTIDSVHELNPAFRFEVTPILADMRDEIMKDCEHCGIIPRDLFKGV